MYEILVSKYFPSKPDEIVPLPPNFWCSGWEVCNLPDFFSFVDDLLMFSLPLKCYNVPWYACVWIYCHFFIKTVLINSSYGHKPLCWVRFHGVFCVHDYLFHLFLRLIRYFYSLSSISIILTFIDFFLVIFLLILSYCALLICFFSTFHADFNSVIAFYFSLLSYLSKIT